MKANQDLKKGKFFITTFIITFAGFIWLTFCVKAHLNFISTIDSYEHFMMTHFTSINPATVNFLSNIGSPVVGIVLITLVALNLCHRKDYLDAFLCETSAILGNILAEILKITIARPRPSYRLYADSSFSFPSGHVFDTTLLVLVLVTFIVPRIKNDTYQVISTVLLIIWNGFIIFSRVFLGEHYFTDTLGSILLAIALWTLTLFLKNDYLNRKNEIQ